MGRRKYTAWHAPKNIRKVKIVTKKQLSQMPESAATSQQDMPVKVRRTFLRRSNLPGNSVARPICFLRDTPLSPFYDPNSEESYVDQLYILLRKIGQGCFGDVFLAVSKENRQLWAIKVSNDIHAFIDFGEVRRWEKVKEHKNCVKFVRAWQQSYRLYIQMELCLTSLDKLLVVNHHVREPQCWDILVDVCQGLKNLHDSQLIHLDIKPANIMLTNNGVCKIGDFGLIFDLQEMDSTTKRIRRSAMSVSEGDGKYVAMELLREGLYTKAADIFSLGLMMMEVASDVALPSCGPLWEGLRNGELPICYIRRRLGQSFRQLVSSMMQKDYTKRPSVDDILKNRTVMRVLAEHNAGKRMNYLASWEQQVMVYQQEHPNSFTLDVPANQIQEPLAPRRPHSMNYLPPNTTPRPMNVDSNGEGEEETKESTDVQIEKRANRARRVSRRLFD